MVAVNVNILRNIVWLVVWLVNFCSQIQIYIEKVYWFEVCFYGYFQAIFFEYFAIFSSLFAQFVLLFYCKPQGRRKACLVTNILRCSHSSETGLFAGILGHLLLKVWSCVILLFFTFWISSSMFFWISWVLECVEGCIWFKSKCFFSLWLLSWVKGEICFPYCSL